MAGKAGVQVSSFSVEEKKKKAQTAWEVIFPKTCNTEKDIHQPH